MSTEMNQREKGRIATTRRGFLAATTAAGMAIGAPAVLGADKNKKYKTALIGCGWWGMNILKTAIAAGRSEVVGMCDVDRNQIDPAAAEVEKLTGSTPKKYHDFRDMIAKEKPEIVIVATPDHWHPLCTIAAVNAGAHVYVEKPISHTVLEGSAMVKAARDADRTVQVGTHRRVSPHNMSAIKFLKEGKAGKVSMVRAFVHYPGGPGKLEPDSDPPEGLDWNFWCGPAPLVPFNKRIHPRGFRYFSNFANGMLGDWGIHWLDQILWWTDEKCPRAVYSTGAKHVMRENSDLPDTQIATFEFESFTAMWEHRRCAGAHAEKHNIGLCFYGTEGTVHLGWLDGWTFYPRNSSKSKIHEKPQLHDPDKQNIPELWADFLSSIESGKRPICDIEVGHRSTTMSLLGMLSLQLGRSVRWDGEQEKILDDVEANNLLRRDYRAPWVYPEV